MPEVTRWRAARFRNSGDRDEFIAHAKTLEIEGIVIERRGAEADIRFHAPPEVEIGIKGMIDAHGGKVVPLAETDGRLEPCATDSRRS